MCGIMLKHVLPGAVSAKTGFLPGSTGFATVDQGLRKIVVLMIKSMVIAFVLSVLLIIAAIVYLFRHNPHGLCAERGPGLYAGTGDPCPTQPAWTAPRRRSQIDGYLPRTRRSQIVRSSTDTASSTPNISQISRHFSSPSRTSRSAMLRRNGPQGECRRRSCARIYAGIARNRNGSLHSDRATRDPGHRHHGRFRVLDPGQGQPGTRRAQQMTQQFLAKARSGRSSPALNTHVPGGIATTTKRRSTAIRQSRSAFR